MIVTNGIEIRLYPTKGQANMINKNIGAARVAYNAMLYRKRKHFEETKESLNIKPVDLYDEFPWMKEVDSSLNSNRKVIGEVIEIHLCLLNQKDYSEMARFSFLCLN